MVLMHEIKPLKARVARVLSPFEHAELHENHAPYACRVHKDRLARENAIRRDGFALH
jgi:hypothetical protein